MFLLVAFYTKLQSRTSRKGCVFSIEIHYRTSILHREIFNRNLIKHVGKIHGKGNMLARYTCSINKPCEWLYLTKQISWRQKPVVPPQTFPDAPQLVFASCDTDKPTAMFVFSALVPSRILVLSVRRRRRIWRASAWRRLEWVSWRKWPSTQRQTSGMPRLPTRLCCRQATRWNGKDASSRSAMTSDRLVSTCYGQIWWKYWLRLQLIRYH